MSTTVVEQPAVAQTATPAAPTRPASFTNCVMAEKYVALRDKVAEIKKRQSDELAQYNVAMATLEAWMLDELNRSGSQSIKTEGGTFFKTTRTSVTCPRWSLTLAWIQEHEAWDLLEARVSKTAVDAHLQEMAAKAELARAAGEVVDPETITIPGVVISRDIGLNVRRS